MYTSSVLFEDVAEGTYGQIAKHKGDFYLRVCPGILGLVFVFPPPRMSLPPPSLEPAHNDME
jgi:hypothetical protein